MTAALILLGYGVLGCTLGRRLLLRSAWPQANPRLGILSWQTLTASVALAWFLAALALALCTVPLRDTVAWATGLTPDEVMRHYEPPAGDWFGVLAVLCAAAMLSTILVRFCRTMVRAAQSRRRQLDLLTLVGTAHADGFTVIDSAEPVVYCVPGRRRAVVVSQGALDLLTEHELRSVLQHERLHLRAHHHLAVAFAGAVASAFGGVRLFTEAREQIEVLVEMQADDAAHGVADRRALARALVTLGTGRRPEATLAAGSTAAARRVRRLASGSAPLGPAQRVVVGLGLAGLLSLPVGLALAPAFGAASSECCERVVTHAE